MITLPNLVLLAGFLLVCGLNAQTPEVIARQIRAEAIRSNHDSAGRPLPLVSHWTTGSHRLSAGWAPEKQMELIKQGHFILPWFAHPSIATNASRGLKKISPVTMPRPSGERVN